MAYPYRFAAVNTLVTPQIDADFDAVGALVVNQCTATGTNTIALTSVAGQPAVTAYTNYAPIFAFPAANTNSGATTINVNTIGAKPLYKDNGGTLAGSGDIIASRLYYVSFNQALNSGGGGFVIINPAAPTPVVSGAVQGSHKNLVVTNGGTANTQCTITADAVSLSDGATTYFTAQSVNVTISSAASGANGLDTGSVANSTCYAMYVIYNPGSTTKAGLMSASFTSPTLPSGYTQYARVGAMFTDGSAHFMRTLQKGNTVQYVVTAATNTAALPNIANGTAGTFSSTAPTYAAASVSTVVPPTASIINVVAIAAYNNLTTSNMLVAPNASYSGYATTNPPPWSFPFPNVSGATGSVAFSMVLESTNIYWASSAAGGAVSCQGWQDNL